MRQDRGERIDPKGAGRAHGVTGGELETEVEAVNSGELFRELRGVVLRDRKSVV